jgi:hypothetical protein
MADQSTPKAMSGLTAREQEILVAALSKCLKSGDIQVSPFDPPHSRNFAFMSLYCFSVPVPLLGSSRIDLASMFLLVIKL